MTLKQADEPIDYEIVRRDGIHPFYLKMTVDEVLLAASGWTIRKVQRHSHLDSFELELSNCHGSIELCAININELLHSSKTYLVYYLYTEFGKICGGSPLRSKSDAELVERFDLIEDQVLIDDENGDLLYVQYKSRDGRLIVHRNGDHVEVSVSVDLFEASG